MERITYGEGGFDPDKPDNNVVSITDIDADAGTVTVTEGGQTVQTALDPATQAAIKVAANRSTIEGQAETALGANTTFLAIASPTAAQNAAQVKALTRQSNKLIRLLLDKLDGTE